MPKRKRGGGPFKPKPTAGPVDESSGQRSVFPEVLPVSARDSEWRYDASDNDEREEDEDFAEQFFSVNAPEDGVEEEGVDDEEEEYSVEEGPEDEDDWDVEPQTEAIAYLEKVRSEASGLPSLTYVPEKASQTNGITSVSPKNDPISDTESDKLWRTQFLQYYTSLREAIATAPEPTLSQPELDSLLHINPHNRPQSPDQEDRLWRLKTLDQPSILLLSMLDHQRTMHLLTHLRKKVSAGVKEEQCMWLVFLLARLGDVGVLSGGEVDLLRRIGRKCLGIRNGVENGTDGSKIVLGTVDMVVCIIKHYYQQKDLEETVQESA
jgi:hypothetical protein